MSIYATNFIIDEETGEAKLVKHLNQRRIDRSTWIKNESKGWNKSGKKARSNKLHNLLTIKERRLWKLKLKVV